MSAIFTRLSSRRHYRRRNRQPANSYVPPPGTWKAPDTGDFVRRGSITEGTTKLLEKDDY